MPTHEWTYGPLMEQGCVSSDPAFPIEFRGHPSDDPGDDPRFVWKLPVSPFETQRGYLDRDGDGLLDWAEAELAWVFRPYLILDHAEEWAGNAHMSNLNGLVVLYQTHPMEIVDPDTRSILVKLIFTFRDDRCHAGDTEAITFVLESPRDTHGSFRKWAISKILYRSGGDQNREKCLIPSSECADLRYYLEMDGYYEDGTSSQQFLTENAICLPPIYISKGKHGLYGFGLGTNTRRMSTKTVWVIAVSGVSRSCAPMSDPQPTA